MQRAFAPAARSVTHDVLVIGTGAGGLTCAITAAKLGLDVLVVEKESTFGGTTALSGGWLWIPCNPLALRANVDDSLDAARTYLRHELGDRYDANRIDAYLESGPRMVEFIERETAVKFFLGTSYPDYHPDQPGGRAGGRAICPQPFDGRALGRHLGSLRPPVRETTLFGLKVGSGPDFKHFFDARRSLKSALYVLGRVARHVADVATHGRDLTLMSGNALAGSLGKTLFDLKVPLWLSTPAVELTRDEDRVTGAIVERDGERITVTVRRGVVLACGGFPHDAARRASLYPHAPDEGEHYSLAAPGNTGDGLRMAERAGGVVDRAVESPAAWMPVSRVPYRDGSFGVYPHSFERGKPGVIAVGRDAKRFTNESDSYHDFVRALIASSGNDAPRCWFIADARFVSRYGLGMAKPFPLPFRRHLESGYLISADTIEGLAKALALDAAQLARTVAEFNAGAARGEDRAYGRGSNVYNRYQGDAAHVPNACLATIETPPFYAVRVLPGDLGTFAGLATDRNASVLDAQGRPISGLHAVGTDGASLFAGVYPGPGATLGPAMTFGFLCAEHLARSGTAASDVKADVLDVNRA